MPALSPSTLDFLKVLSNEKRLIILEWLLDPEAHFPRQIDGDLIEDGVCLGAIVRKVRASQPTVTGYMQTLVAAGLVSSKKVKNWVFFKARREAIAAALADLGRHLLEAPRSTKRDSKPEKDKSKRRRKDGGTRSTNAPAATKVRRAR